VAYLRLASIPVDHLVAETAAFPLASEAAFQFSPVALDPFIAHSVPSSDRSKPGGTAEITANLWRAAERALVTRSPSVSLDEVVAIRDRLWFRRGLVEQGQPVPLATYLRSIATNHLRARGAKAVPCLQLDSPSDDLEADSVGKPRSREAWRWLTFALPPDLLLAAAGKNLMPSEVETLSPQMDQTLRHYGYAESHLHLGAGLDFRLLWIATMCGIAEHSTTEGAFRSPGAELDEGRNFVHWLVRAAIARYVLASFLLRYDPSSEKFKNFGNYLKFVLAELIAKRLGTFGAVILNRALGQFAAGRLNRGAIALAEYQIFYARLSGASARAMPQGRSRWDPQSPSNRRCQMDLAYQADPLAKMWMVGNRHQPTAEMRFVAAGLNYLESTESDDVEFSRLFWQVIRMRNLLYRHIVQRPMTPGLPWFVRTYSRISPARRPIKTALQVESAAISCGYGRGLKALEVRASPSDNASEMLSFVHEADRHFRSLALPESCAGTPEFGFVFHLARQRKGGSRQGLPNAFWSETHADPTIWPARDTPATNPTGYRYASFYQNARRDALAFGRMLLNFPMSLSLVRGIDLCTDELAIPTWVMVPLFRYLRDVSFRVSHWLDMHCGLEIPPLRTTVHAGEDFVHLLGGLRRIDESIRRLGLREGDRIGHGIALGIDVRQWTSSAGRIGVPREERLCDLVWEWICYARRQVPMEVGRRAFVEREIARLTRLIFGKSISPYQAEILLEMLYRENDLAAAGFPHGQSTWATATKVMTASEFVGDNDHGAEEAQASKTPVVRLANYLRNPSVFRRGRTIEWVDPAKESAALESLQQYLRVEIGKRGLVVEVNPSSNLLIANLGDLSGHPLWRLDPPVGGDDTPPVSVCIGSDDPITFATNLRHEYMLIHDTLIMAGCSESEAAAWLDRTRETSLMMRFTIPRSPNTNVKKPCGPVDDSGIRLPP